MKKDINKFKGCLIGGAIGDALGYPIEFVKLNENEIITQYKDEAIISDDTQMTLFTANGLLWNNTRFNTRGIAPSISDSLYLAYQDWYKTQKRNDNYVNISWLANIPQLNGSRAPGNTCMSALGNNKKGTIENPINDSKGCGSVMRVAPIGLFFEPQNRSLNEIGKYGAEAGAITHGHPLGIISCYVLTIIINNLTYTDKTIEESTDDAIEMLKNNFDIFDKENEDYFISLIKKAEELAHNDFFSDKEAIKELGEGWVAEEALAIALYSAIKYSDSFEKTIICSINHDGDSDSTGAIAGNIIGTYLGYDKIPSYYIEKLELKDIILEIAEDLFTGCPIDEYSDNKDEYWESKYIYLNRDLSRRKLNRNVIREKLYNINHNSEDYENNFISIVDYYFSNYKFESNENFLFSGRKKFLYDEFYEYLNNKEKYKNENPIRFAITNLEEFISNDNFVADNSELRDKNDNYSASGYICLEEKEIIIKMLDRIKKELLESSGYSNNN